VTIPHRPFPIGDTLERFLYLQPFSRYQRIGVRRRINLSESPDVIEIYAINNQATNGQKDDQRPKYVQFLCTHNCQFDTC